MPSYNRQLAANQLKGKRSLSIFAFDSNVGTDLEDMWQGKILPVPVNNMTFMETADFIIIKSDNPADTFAGAGTRTVLVDYVDENYLRVVEPLNMNGAGGVSTTKKGFGVNVLSAIVNGTLGESNYGIITAEALGTGDIQAVMAIGEGRNQDSHMFVPEDEEAFLTRLTLTGEKNAEYKIVFSITPFVTSVPGSSSLTSIPFIFFESAIDIVFNVPPLFPRASRVNMKVLSDTGPTNKVSGSYDMELTKIGVS